MKCNHCSYQNPEGIEYCKVCGTKLVNPDEFSTLDEALINKYAVSTPIDDNLPKESATQEHIEAASKKSYTFSPQENQLTQEQDLNKEQHLEVYDTSQQDAKIIFTPNTSEPDESLNRGKKIAASITYRANTGYIPAVEPLHTPELPLDDSVHGRKNTTTLSEFQYELSQKNKSDEDMDPMIYTIPVSELLKNPKYKKHIPSIQKELHDALQQQPESSSNEEEKNIFQKNENFYEELHNEKHDEQLKDPQKYESADKESPAMSDSKESLFDPAINQSFHETKEEIPDQLEKETKPLTSASDKKANYIIVALVVILIAILFFIIHKLDLFHSEPQDTTIHESTLASEIYPSSEEQINQFIAGLPSYIAGENKDILALFTNTIDASESLNKLEPLKGQIDHITIITVTKSNDRYIVRSTIKKIDGTDQAIVWKFIAPNHGQFASLKHDYDSSALTITTTEGSSTETITESPTLPTTESTILKGFITSGSFEGGQTASTFSNITGYRVGNNGEFQRLVIDFNNSDHLPIYHAVISDNQSQLTLTIKNLEPASTFSNELFNGNTLFKQAEMVFPSPHSIQLTIKTKQPAQFRIFGIDHPHRLVIDAAPL